MIIVLGILAAIAVAFVVFWRRGKARKQRVIEVGQGLGLSPITTIPSHFATKLFKQRDNPQFLQPALEGTISGRRLLVFDYSYSSGTDENPVTFFRTVVAYALPEQNVPSFGLQKRSLLKRGIEIEGNLDFAKRFCVSGEDPAAIRSLFSPSLVSFLTSTELDKQREPTARVSAMRPLFLRQRSRAIAWRRTSIFVILPTAGSTVTKTTSRLSSSA